MRRGKSTCSAAPAAPSRRPAAEASAVEADLADTHVQLSAEIAQAYVDLRDQQQRIVLVRESAELEEQVLTLTQQRRAQGVASDLDVERIRTQVENTRGTLIPLDAQITESLDQLATLTGREPGALDAELTDTGALPGTTRDDSGRRPGRAAEAATGHPSGRVAARVDECADWRARGGLVPETDFAGRPGFHRRESRAPGALKQLHLGRCAAATVERTGLRPHEGESGPGQSGF